MKILFDGVERPVGVSGSLHMLEWSNVPQEKFQIVIPGLLDTGEIISGNQRYSFTMTEPEPLTEYPIILKISNQSETSVYNSFFRSGTDFSGAEWIGAEPLNELAELPWFSGSQQVCFGVKKDLKQAYFDGAGLFTVSLNGSIIAKTNQPWGQTEKDPFIRIPCTYLIQGNNCLEFDTNMSFCGRLTLIYSDGTSEIILPEQGKCEQQGALYNHSPSPILEKRFYIDTPPVSSTLYICGLGYFDALLNGKRISENWLMPDYTNYCEHIHYLTFPVDVKAGENTLRVALGKGYYAMGRDWICGHLKNQDDLPGTKLLAQLLMEFGNGEKQIINSDLSWRYCYGSQKYDNLFYGEYYDATAEPVLDSAWHGVTLATSPLGKVTSMILPPIRTRKVIDCQLVEQGDGYSVYDAGCVIAGTGSFTFSEDAGTCVRIAYEEKLSAQLHGGIPIRQADEQFWQQSQIDTYICKGQPGETWTPRFTYKGFRYIILQGNRKAVKVQAIQFHNDIKANGRFECSEPLFNKMHETTVHTILINLHSIPTDTPMHEKRGWTGDAQVICETAMMIFDMQRFFTKWLTDLSDCQSIDGAIPHTCPGTSYYGKTPAWMSAYIIICYQMYRYYGDLEILKTHFQGLRRYVDYEIANLQDGIATDIHYCDWSNPDSDFAPEGSTLFATLYVYHAINLFSKICKLLNEPAWSYYAEQAASVRNVINTRFFDGEVYHTDIECGYRQSSNVLALALGVVEDKYFQKVLDNLARDIVHKDYHCVMGCFAFQYVLPLLSKNGYHDIALKVAKNTTFPSLGEWLERGATAWLESWDYDHTRSYSHYFFGTIVAWFYQCIAGFEIRKPGFEEVFIRPNLSGVESGNVELFHYKIKWNRKTLQITVPQNKMAWLDLSEVNDSSEQQKLTAGTYIYELT